MSSNLETKSRPTIHSKGCGIINKVIKNSEVKIWNFQLKMQQNMLLQQQEN
jgi:hypothetical protein